nr:glutamyl-tRNA(Gln) amidotransferase subunit A, chloroplastic/mitochondrial [Tanacetum cinerariifolium]
MERATSNGSLLFTKEGAIYIQVSQTGEKKNDPLAMYAGDIMTVNVNLAGLPALVGLLKMALLGFLLASK